MSITNGHYCLDTILDMKDANMYVYNLPAYVQLQLETLAAAVFGIYVMFRLNEYVTSILPYIIYGFVCVTATAV